MNTNNKIIYSLRVCIELQKRGFKPILDMKNPYKANLTCWVFEETEAFQKALTEIVGGA